MSSIFARFKAAFQAQANQIANQWEDPKASLDYSLAKLEEQRLVLNRSLIQVHASRQRLETQSSRVEEEIQKNEEQAGSALNAGREDLARVALERKQEAGVRLAELEGHLGRLKQQESSLKETHAKLERKIALFRSKNEELKSMYDSTRAQLRIQEALSGISDDLADVGNTIQRIEARIQDMQLRADAIDRLISDGMLTNVFELRENDVDHQLARIKRDQAVETELQRLKAEASA